MEYYFADGSAQAYDFDDIVNELVSLTQEDVLNRIQCYQAIEPSEIMSDNVFKQTNFDQANEHGDKNRYRIQSPVSIVLSKLYGGSHFSYRYSWRKGSPSFAESISLPVHSFDYLSGTSIKNVKPDCD